MNNGNRFSTVTLHSYKPNCSMEKRYKCRRYVYKKVLRSSITMYKENSYHLQKERQICNPYAQTMQKKNMWIRM
jgi:hypothetical protein